MRKVLSTCCTSLLLFAFISKLPAQTLQYLPSKVLHTATALNVLEVHSIRIQNTSGQDVDLAWNIIENKLPASWYKTMCDENVCHTNIPNSGYLGKISSGGDNYIGLNINAYSKKDSGTIRIEIYDYKTSRAMDTLEWFITSDPKIPQLNRSTAFFTLYPNPATDELNLKLLKGGFASYEVRIYRADGQLVNSQLFKNTALLNVSLNNYSAGIYTLLLLEDGKPCEARKFVVH